MLLFLLLKWALLTMILVALILSLLLLILSCCYWNCHCWFKHGLFSKKMDYARIRCDINPTDIAIGAIDNDNAVIVLSCCYWYCHYCHWYCHCCYCCCHWCHWCIYIVICSGIRSTTGIPIPGVPTLPKTSYVPLVTNPPPNGKESTKRNPITTPSEYARGISGEGMNQLIGCYFKNRARTWFELIYLIWYI